MPAISGVAFAPDAVTLAVKNGSGQVVATAASAADAQTITDVLNGKLVLPLPTLIKMLKPSAIKVGSAPQ